MFSYLFALQLGAVHLEYVDDYTTSVSFPFLKNFRVVVFSPLYIATMFKMHKEFSSTYQLIAVPRIKDAISFHFFLCSSFRWTLEKRTV